jgi:hypothetical protein
MSRVPLLPCPALDRRAGHREQVARFFEGTELVEPGLVRVEEWRPDPVASGAGRSPLWCGVGRKR